MACPVDGPLRGGWLNQRIPSTVAEGAAGPPLSTQPILATNSWYSHTCVAYCLWMAN